MATQQIKKLPASMVTSHLRGHSTATFYSSTSLADARRSDIHRSVAESNNRKTRIGYAAGANDAQKDAFIRKVLERRSKRLIKLLTEKL